MTKRNRLLPFAVVLIFGIGLVIWSRKETPATASNVAVQSSHGFSGFAPQRERPAPTPHAITSVTKFANLGIVEADAQLREIKEKNLTTIFHVWREANRVDQDLMKQGAIATILAYALREKQPTAELIEEMWRFVMDSSNSFQERAAVIGIFGGAKTKEAVDFLLKAASVIENTELRRVALTQISGVGALWGDGSYHEERSPALERTWRESADPDLLIVVAVAMARIGAPSAIGSLLSAALIEDGKDDVRKRAALGVLEKIYTRNAVPPAAALLTKQHSTTPASTLAGGTLVGIGDSSAAQALLGWLQNADAAAAAAARTFVSRTHTPELLAAWSASLDSKTVFRSEEIREAIRGALTEYYQNHNSTR